MVVASHVAGRIRIRDEKLRREAVAGRVRDALAATPGVSDVEVNPRVGSVLVIYSAVATGGEAVLEVVSGLLGSVEEGVPAAPAAGCPKISLTISPKMKRKAVNIGMLSALVLSLAALLFHLKKLHYLAGIVFVALFGDHLYERRQLLFG